VCLGLGGAEVNLSPQHTASREALCMVSSCGPEKGKENN
jgi:hypothetical protein